MQQVTVSNSRYPPWSTRVGRGIASLLVFVIFLPYMGGPLIGDDLTLVTSSIHAYSLGVSLPAYALELASLSTSNNHVLPLGGLVTAAFTWPLAALGSLGVSVPWLWSLLRVFLIVVTLYTAARAATEWIASRYEATQKRRVQWMLFFFSAAAAGAFVQVHGYWSQDPILAYGIASWFSAILVFVFLWVARLIMTQEAWAPLWAKSTACFLIGVVGLFFYEMTVIAPLAILLMAPLVFAAQPDVTERKGLLFATLTSAAVVLVFGLTQFLRLGEGGSYRGSSPGFGDLFVPVWVTGMVGNLPLTNLPLTLQFSLIPAVNPFLGVLIAGAVLSLWLVGFSALRHLNVTVSGRSVLLCMGIFVLLVGLATALYAATSKYQMELGTEIGRTYLFYVFGLVALAICVALGAFMIGEKTSRRAQILLIGGASLSVFALVQYTINSASLAAINDNWSWTSQYVNSLQDVKADKSVCLLLSRLEASDVPEAYKSQIKEQTMEIFGAQERRVACLD